MKACNFEKLVAFLDKRLGIDAKLDVLEHLDHCDICRDAVFHITRDRDGDLFTYRPCKAEKSWHGEKSIRRGNLRSFTNGGTKCGSSCRRHGSPRS